MSEKLSEQEEALKAAYENRSPTSIQEKQSDEDPDKLAEKGLDAQGRVGLESARLGVDPELTGGHVSKDELAEAKKERQKRAAPVHEGTKGA